MGEDKNGDVTQEVVFKKDIKDWRVTGGGVGQFCSSLWSLQLKLPSHLGQFISIFTLGFVKIPTQNCGEGFYEGRWWSWHHVLLIMIQWKWATSCTWWWDAKTHTRLYSFLIQIMQQCNETNLISFFMQKSVHILDTWCNLNSNLMQSPFWQGNCSAEHPTVTASFPKPNYTIWADRDNLVLIWGFPTIIIQLSPPLSPNLITQSG